MSGEIVLALFDFDKTLVSRDSFRLFGELAARSRCEHAVLFLIAGITKLGWIDNTRYKERVLDRVWRRRPAHERSELLERHARAMSRLGIEPAWARLHAHLERGDHVAVLSASPDFYLAPYLERISPAIEVHGSTVEEKESGVRISNLYRQAKANRAAQIVATIAPARTIVYTDHRDDIEMMRLADRVVLVRPQDTTRQQVHEAGIEFEVLA